jgi:hypothetical protein
VDVIEQTTSRLVLRPTPDLVMRIFLAIVAIGVIGVVATAKRTTFECVREPHGGGRCTYIEAGWFSAERQEFPLEEVRQVEIRLRTKREKDVYVNTPDDALYVSSNPADGDRLNALLASRATGRVATVHDNRGDRVSYLLLLVAAAYMGYLYTLKTTIDLDRGQGRVRVSFKGLLGEHVREVRYDELTVIEVAPEGKSLTQLTARLKAGDTLPLAPPLVAILDKDALAERMSAFFRASGSPVPRIERRAPGFVLTKGMAIASGLGLLPVVIGWVLNLLASR